MEDLSVILLGAAAIAAGVVLATAQQRQAGGVTPAARMATGGAAPAGLTQAPARQPIPTEIQSSLKGEILRGMGQAGRLPTVAQRTAARNIARENMRQFCLRYPEQCCGEVGSPGGYGVMGFG